ncbi:MAG: NAD(P)-binding protein, partial [Pseudorhodobacter sp.]|nr:NAD(P)-binding protein [Rhizobacter sp.]
MKSYFTPAEVNRPGGPLQPLSNSGHSNAVANGSAPVALVVGAGFGGMAAAIRLSVMGYRVQLLEKLDGPGGRAYVRKQDGFTFDGGPTIITVP